MSEANTERSQSTNSSLMAQEKQEQKKPSIPTLQEREEEKAPSLSSRVASLLLGDGTAQPFDRWVALVRERSGKFRPSGFPHRPSKPTVVTRGFEPPPSAYHQKSFEGPNSGGPDVVPLNSSPCDQSPEMNLWERLGIADTLDIESTNFFWDGLSSLHHTEHTSSNEHSEDEMNKALEVTVNSGGVVFFALFNTPENNNLLPKESAAVIKIASSRMAVQSERLGYELAKWLGVRTPQARVVHNSSTEWQWIKDAAERARDSAISLRDEVGEITCSELLEALELSRCLLLMNYVHGSPLVESPEAFDSQDATKITAAALGKVLMLDLILRNEDRLPCRHLGWRGNSSNLLFTDKLASSKLDALEGIYDFSSRKYKTKMIRILQRERRSYSANARLVPHNEIKQTKNGTFGIVTIDSGVPRRPPAGKRLKDQERYPKVVELMLNSPEYSSNILYEISGGKLGFPITEEDAMSDNSSTSGSETDMMVVVHEFRRGFRAALRDLQGFHLFLLTLHQKLDGLLRISLTIINRISGDSDKDDFGALNSSSDPSGLGFVSPSSCKGRMSNKNYADSVEYSPAGSRGSPDSTSPVSRENWSGRYFKGSGEPPQSLRLTMKLRDLNKLTRAAPELNKELEQWNELFLSEVIKFCHENNFNTGFFEGNDNNIVDAYELKVRLEHILERIGLISDAANTERPSLVTDKLFIGGALAARSMYTLQHLGITRILCLCSNEIGQSDSQYPDRFEYKNFSITDDDDTNITALFEEASDFIDCIEQSGGKVLVHCFEGKSRSATVVLAYIMLRKGFTLSDAWKMLKKAHRRAQPNDGFAKALLDLDRTMNGKASMDWQQRRPAMKFCPVCGKNVGLSTGALKLHLQKSHREISSGSVDSAMTVEIQKALEDLKIGSLRGQLQLSMD